MKNFPFGVLVLAALALTGCGPSNGPVGVDSIPAEYAGLTNPLSGDAASPGAGVYRNNCLACHGPQGRGDGPAGAALDPQPKDLLQFAPTVGDDYLFWRINTGKPGTSMVAWRGVLTDEQIWQTIAFIRTLKP